MITVLGAGSIGCYVGGMLACNGAKVTLIGRPALVQSLSHSLVVTALDKDAVQLGPDRFSVATNPECLAQATMILLCVKSADTATAAQIIKTHAPKAAPVISLQNGVTNVETLRQVLGQERVVAGMVGFNVVREAPDRFTQTTEGEVILDPDGADLREQLLKTPIPASCHENMLGVQWSKLLMNLNNALNALSGLGLKAQLEDRAWRQVLAACITEGLHVAAAEGVQIEKIGKIHPRRLPFVLRLPNWIFLRIAQSMLRIDPAARSSMADDYAQGRPPEVPWLNGHIVTRGKLHRVPTPTNARVCAMIEDAFRHSARPAMHFPASALIS